MNRFQRHSVPSPERLRWIVIVIMMGGLGQSPGCVDVDGGAVELSWSLRTPEGEPNTCLGGGSDRVGAGIDRVRLCWAPADVSASVFTCDSSRTFLCEEARGFSSFEIEPGPTAFWIEPLCEATQVVPDPATYEVPAPIIRSVSAGQVVTLNSLLIIATDGRCTSSRCTCIDNPSGAASF